MKPSNIILLQALAFYAVVSFIAFPLEIFPEIQFLTGGNYQTLLSFASTYSPKNAFFTVVLVFLAICAFNFVLAGILLTREFHRTTRETYENKEMVALARKAFLLYLLFLSVLVACICAYGVGLDVPSYF